MIYPETKEVIEKINSSKAKTVVLQVPEGMKDNITGFVEALEKACPETQFITLMDPCWGACDLGDEKAVKLGGNLLVHFGHSKMYSPKLETIFVPIKYELDFEKITNEIIKKLKELNYKSCSLVASTQFTHALPEIQKRLKEKGFNACLQKGSHRVQEAGQVLGCNYTAATFVKEEVDCIVYVGDGLFHPLGLQFATEKHCIQVNPMNESVFDLQKEKDKFLRLRHAAIVKAQEAKSIGIIMSTKVGQLQKHLAFKAKKMIEESGKKAYLYSVDLLDPNYFIGVNVEAFVCVACPRIALDDTEMWKKPMLNPTELEIALGKRKLEDYSFDEIF